MRKLRFDGFIWVDAGYRYLGQTGVMHDCVVYYGFGFWWFAVGWHWE